MRNIVLILVLFYSCTYKQTETIDYTEYYDNEKKEEAIKGQLFNGQEIGEWVFHSENGTIRQKGHFVSGLQHGIWFYEIDGVDSQILWKEVDTQNINFSLPHVFKYCNRLSDSSKISYLHESTSVVICILHTVNCDTFCVSNFYDLTLADMKTVFDVISSKSVKIHSKYGFYYYDWYLAQYNPNYNTVQYYLYKNIDNKENIVVTVIGKEKYKNYMKFLLGEVFYHVKYSYKRVAFPYGEDRFENLVNESM